MQGGPLIHDTRTLLIAICSLLVGVGIGILFSSETIVVREGTPNTPAGMSSVNLMIDYGNGRIRTWNTVSWHESMSIMNLLESVGGAQEIILLPIEVDGKKIGIESIDGIKNDPESGERWQYWINNTYEPAPAGKYFLKPGDIVLWKFTREQG